MKHIFNVRFLIITSLVAIPLVVSAQGVTDLNNGISALGGVFNTITTTVLKSLAGLFATAAMAIFFFGIAQYIFGARAGDAKKIEDGNRFMRWGLVALFVMFSVWGIITYVQNIFGIKGQNTIIIPTIDFMRGSGNNSPSSNSANIGLPSAVSRVVGDDCYSKSVGQACTGSGYTGTCGVSDAGVFACYANTGSTFSGSSIFNSLFGNSNPSVSQQNTATNAYQDCMAKGGTGAQCQSVYENSINTKTSSSGTGGISNSCPSGTAYDPGTGGCEPTTSSNSNSCTASGGVLAGDGTCQAAP